MKRNLLLIAALVTGSYGFTQVTDTVSLGASYINENYYKLSDGSEFSVLRDNWDLAFASDGIGFGSSTIRINGGTGTELFKYGSDINDWATVDTTGFDWSGKQLVNSDESWYTGAFDNITPVSSSDLGWGTYSTITHIVTGDRIFLMKLSDGSYRKLIIEKLQSGQYTFKYAMLNGTSEVIDNIVKSNYSGKNFAYYSMQNGTGIDREPVTSTWDLLFTKYITDLGVYYAVTGVLSNVNVKTAKAYPVNDVNTEDFGAQSYSFNMSTIGSDWKHFSFSTGYYVDDSLVYFVEVPNRDVYRIIFTEFGGGANGNCIFTKELVGSTVGIEEDAINNKILSVYPNPASTVLNLTYLGKENTQIGLFDVTGKQIFSKISNVSGLNQETIDVSSLSKGMYFLTLISENNKSTQKIIIK